MTDSKISWKEELRRGLSRWGKFCVVGVLVAIAGGYLGRYFHLCELMSHFQFHYFLASLVLCLFFSCIRDKVWIAIAAVCLLASGIEVAPWYFSRVGKESGDQYRLLLSNVYSDNSNYRRLLALVAEEDPDILILQEVTPTWIENLSALEKVYPFRKLSPRRDNFGLALYSKYPLEASSVLYFSDAMVPSISSRVRLRQQSISLIATHPLPPATKDYFLDRNQQLEKIAAHVGKQCSRMVVIGDLNATMWSPYYRDLVSQTGLLNSRRGFGILPTWPVGAALPMIPIDHCLHAPDLVTRRCWVSENIGSDHYPLVVELAFHQK